MLIGRYLVMAGGVLAASAFLMPDSDGGVQTFAQSAAVVHARLVAARRIVNGTGMGSLTVAAAGQDGDALLVRVTRAGDPPGPLCRVGLAAVTPGQTQAMVDCTQPGKGTPIRQVSTRALALVVREHVAAAAEARRYDVDRVSNGMLALVLANRPTIADDIADGAAARAEPQRQGR